VIEPIDFSANEDEYLSSDLKQQVLAFSILWAVLGFLLSAWLFLGKKVGPASLILDRRAAEGRVVDASSHGGSTSSGFDGFSSRAPHVQAYVPSAEVPPERWTHLAKLEPGSSPPSSQAPEQAERHRHATVVEASAEVASSVPTRITRRHPSPPRQVSRPSTPVEAAEDPDRLLYPAAASRPERSNLTAVARQVERSMIRMANIDGISHVGLILDSSGRTLVSDQFLSDGSLDRITIEGRMERATLLSRDPEYGLALIQLPAGRYGPPIPLAPDPPARGEELLAFGPSPSRCLSTVVRAGAGFGAAGFLVEGYLGSSTWGTPLLNDRGELVGCQFSSLPDFPGSGVHLAADSAAIYRLLRGYDSSDTSALDQSMQQAYSRLTSLAAETRDEDGTRKGRILARVGVSQFFIGMSTEEASQWVNSPSRTSGSPGVENWSSQAPPVQLVFVNDRLVAVATDFTGFSTLTGLSMGARVDRRTLSRAFDRFLLVDGLALTPGLDILLDHDGKARQFVVRPEL
jgi:hypothetical protein